MTTDELRRALVADADAVIQLPWIARKLITAAQMLRVKAQREYWQTAPDAELASLQTQLDRLSASGSMNPNLRSCETCGHEWGSHRIDDSHGPVLMPCGIPGCVCRTFVGG